MSSFEGYVDAATRRRPCSSAVIDLVAAVGLWLAAPWGAVVWLTSVISMVAVEVLFPQIYGGRIWVVAIDVRPDLQLSLARADGGARAAAVILTRMH